MLPPEMQVMRKLTMTPLRCEKRGGDQERVSVRVVTDDTRLRGGPLGTMYNILKCIKQDLLEHAICSPSCRVITLIVAAGPPPTLV